MPDRTKRTEVHPGSFVTIGVTEVLSPPVEVFSLEITALGGSWPESFGTRAELDTFVRGLKAGAALFAKIHLLLPEMPD